ncbi:MAG: ABC transporter permease [Spirochaetia bacterium]
MPVLLRMAIRNLWEHRGKTLIIGIIVAVGVMVLIIGTSFIDTAADGIEKSFIDNYTGHIMISGIAEAPVSLFGVQSVGGLDPTPVLPNYDEIREYVLSLEEVEIITPQITGFGVLRPNWDELALEESTVFTLLFGIEADSYHEMFDNIELIEGDYLSPGERGIMISADRIESMRERVQDGYEEAGLEVPELEDVQIPVGTEIRIVSFGGGALPRIRVVPLVGIYEPINPDQGVGTSFVSYLDAQTQRSLQGIAITYQGEFEIPEDATSLLDSFDNQDPVSQEDLFSSETGESDPFSDPFSEDVTTTLEEEDFDNILGAVDETDNIEEPVLVDTGSWQYLLLKVENPGSVNRTINQLNDWFAQEGIAAQAGGWEDAAGPFATTADTVRLAFVAVIIFIGIVAIGIIINTLIVSIIERTKEIGTMRALGAQKQFVWKMIFLETMTITVVFGAIGVVLAVLIVGVLNIIGIQATNTFLRILFGGEVLRPGINPWSLMLSVALVTVIAVLAHIYPVREAMKIDPVRAIQSE